MDDFYVLGMLVADKGRTYARTESISWDCHQDDLHGW